MRFIKVLSNTWLRTDSIERIEIKGEVIPSRHISLTPSEDYRWCVVVVVKDGLFDFAWCKTEKDAWHQANDLVKELE